MTDGQKSLTAWIAVALILFGMVSGAIAFTVTTNNKADNNKELIIEGKQKDNNQDERIRYVEKKVDYIERMKNDIEQLKEQNTQILVMLNRMEERANRNED